MPMKLRIVIESKYVVGMEMPTRSPTRQPRIATIIVMTMITAVITVFSDAEILSLISLDSSAMSTADAKGLIVPSNSASLFLMLSYSVIVLEFSFLFI